MDYCCYMNYFFLDYELDCTNNRLQKKSLISKHFGKKMAIGIRTLINSKESIFLQSFFTFVM